MSIIFLRTNTDLGPRTIVFAASEVDARLLADRVVLDQATDVPPVMVLQDRGPYSSVAQIVANREKVLDGELARIKRRNARRSDPVNITRIYPQKGERNDARGKVSKRRP